MLKRITIDTFFWSIKHIDYQTWRHILKIARARLNNLIWHQLVDPPESIKRKTNDQKKSLVEIWTV